MSRPFRATDTGRPHASRLRNPFIANVFYRRALVERWGRGTNMVIEQCEAAGKPVPLYAEHTGGVWVTFPTDAPVAGQADVQVTSEVHPTSTRQVPAVLEVASDPLARADLQEAAGLLDREHFVNEYLRPLLDASLIEMTIPDKPRSSKQRYRLTKRGRSWLAEHGTATT